MRYLARRIRTGEWLSRDLPLSGVQRTHTLSGPGALTADIEAELWTWRNKDDGRRLLDPWGTIIYADDGDHIAGHGIILPPLSFEEATTRVNCIGIAGYPQGLIYDGNDNYGPQTDPTTGALIRPRPDTIALFRTLWQQMQRHPTSDIGVTITGPFTSGVPTGTNEDPVVLSYWRGDDVGGAMDNLAKITPFDYVERVNFTDREKSGIRHEVEVGMPRLGRARTDLRFVTGENIAERPSVSTPDVFTNDVIGFGNGSGSSLVTARSSVDDGRLRRTLPVTDKTIRDEFRLQQLVQTVRERYSGDDIVISGIVIVDHDNARINAIDVGDDILVDAFVSEVGRVRAWSRVLSITTNEEEDVASLSLAPSSSFFYNTTTQVGTADPGEATT